MLYNIAVIGLGQESIRAANPKAGARAASCTVRMAAGYYLPDGTLDGFTPAAKLIQVLTILEAAAASLASGYGKTISAIAGHMSTEAGLHSVPTDGFGMRCP